MIVAAFLAAVVDEGTNSGRTVSNASDHLRAIISWVWRPHRTATSFFES